MEDLVKPHSTTDPKVCSKVIIAVHGIGNQQAFSTIQTVVNWFCKLKNEPTAIPLGSFYTDQALFSIPPPFAINAFQQYVFAEVYWANIPEKFNKRHSLEEVKLWTNTLIERLRLRWRKAKKVNPTSSYVLDCKDADFTQTKLILSEMIQTIAVLERLFFLADRAGLFTFDLRKLIDEYIGDVQIVADFQKGRTKILDTFAAVMEKVEQLYGEESYEIHIVAHSEGTVISFLGLLDAIQRQADVAWIHRVRGFMTFGSPIDKHLILWPELFEATASSSEAVAEQSQPTPQLNWSTAIKWRNYYDSGDPIGSALDGARTWLDKNGLKNVFDFKKSDDMGFSRYILPGEAHVDYWTDEEVFGHFITTVINPQDKSISKSIDGELAVSYTKSAEEGDNSISQPNDFIKPPDNKISASLLSYILPYVGILVLLFSAVYILFKAGRTYIYGDQVNGSTHYIFGSVAGIVFLLVGVTVGVRIPRLTRQLGWRLVTLPLYALSLVIAYRSFVYAQSDPLLWYQKKLTGCLSATAVAGLTYPNLILMGALILFLLVLISSKKPAQGMQPVLILGSIFILGTLMLANGKGPFWPVVLAVIGFLYLWWLAALSFDLVFVWHYYIRHSVAHERIQKMVGLKPPYGV